MARLTSFAAAMDTAGLSESKVSCVKNKESANATLQAELETGAPVSANDATTALQAILSCISKDELGHVVAVGIALPGSGSEAGSPTACVQAIFATAPDADLVALLSDSPPTPMIDQITACLRGSESTGTNPDLLPDSTAFSCSDISLTDADNRDPTSIAAVQAGVCGINPDASWASAVLGHADWETGPNGGSPDGFDIAVLTDEYGSSFTAADALAACNAIDSYLSAIGKSGWPLNIGIGTGTGTATKPDTIFAAKTTTGSCQAP